MSYEGRTGPAHAAAAAGIPDPNWVLRHRGTTSAFLARYRRLARRAAAKKLAGLRELAPSLLEIISDERTLHAAWEYMAANGSHAPGPDGLRYKDLTPQEVWMWCRAVRDTIREGCYTPGGECVRRISKGPGRGFRELVVQSIDDRVVARAVVEVLQPALDPLFDPRSFGYRPAMGPLRALATAEHLSRVRGLGVWVSADIKNAFPSVPVGRLLGVFRKYFPADDLVAFVEAQTRPDTTPGLRQGSPASPLLLNLFLHHILDREWRRLYPDTPLLRFADDVLLLCRTSKRARDAYRDLAAILVPAGFELKEGEADAVRRVAAGDQVKWMGFGITAGPDGLRYAVADAAWAGLAGKFAAAHGRPNSPVAAVAALAGWVADKGPCFPATDLERAYRRIKQLAAANGFEEILEQYEVAGLWQRAYARWCRLRATVAASGAGD